MQPISGLWAGEASVAHSSRGGSGLDAGMRGGCAVGEAVITGGGGDLGVSHVIHTVGPVWRGGGQNEAALLRRAYDSSLRLAADHRLARLAFPNISTGVYGFPKTAVARTTIDAVRAFLAHNDWPRQVILSVSMRKMRVYIKRRWHKSAAQRRRTTSAPGGAPGPVITDKKM